MEILCQTVFYTLQIYFKVKHLHEGLNLVTFLQHFCGNILILVQIQKPILASIRNQIWNPNSLFLFWTEQSLKGKLWGDQKGLDTAGIQSVTASFSTGFDFIFLILPGTSLFLKLFAFFFFFSSLFYWLGSPLEIFHKIPDPSWSDVPMNGRKTACSAETL